MKLKKRLLSLAMLCIAWVGALAYEVGQDITSLATDWTGKTGTYQSKYAEKYSNTAYTEGKILYMSITGLESVGYYEVQFYAVTSMAWYQFATGTSIAEWYVNDVSDYMNVIGQTGCTPESDTNLRTATVYVSDGKLEFGIKNTAKGGNWYVAHVKSIVYKGNPSLANPINITSTYIKNAGYETGDTKGWTTTASSDTGARSTTDNTYKNSNSEGAYLFNTWWKGTPCTQTIASMPAGKYELSAIVASNGATIYLITGDNSAEYAYTETTDGAVGIKLAKEILLSSDATNYKIGVVGGENGTAGEHKAYVEDGYWWYKSDNFQLKYYGNGIDVYAEAKNLGVEFTTVADQWYAIPVAMDGEYIFTVGDGSTITYTQNGTQPISSATGNSATSGTAYTLKAGYVYVKAASATTIKLSAHTKTYNVGSATTATPYIQAGQTVTVTYADAKTNDEAATFAHLTGDITLNGTAVDVNVTGTSFTFTMPADATTSTKYTLSIPAGAFGYAGQKTCDAQTITFTTPAVFDGTYFIKATDATYAGKYISRGADSNTEAALDLWGLPVKVTTDANNVSTIYFVDNNLPLVLNAENIAYTNGDLSNANHKYTYTIAAADGGCTLFNIDKAKYIAAGVRENNEVAMAFDAPYSWQFVTPAVHTTEMTALKNSQAATAATAAGQIASTVDNLKTIVEAWEYNTTQNLTLTVTEYYSDSGNFGNAVGTRSNKVTIDKAGLYKFSMPAFTRASDADAAYDNHLTGTEALVAYIFFGNYKTQIRSLYSEEGTTETGGYRKPANAKLYWANSTTTGDTEFSDGKYANEIWMYLDAGEYEYGITNASKGLCESWTYFNAPTLTLYSNKFEAGTDVTTTYIKNPDFETGNTDNWTIGVSTKDAGARKTSDDTYAAQGSEGNYLFNIWSDGGALTQNIGTLPVGIYQLSAMLATGDSKTSKGTVYLTVNEAKSQGMVSRNGNKKVMHKETLTFVSDGTAETTIGAIGQDLGNGGHWWYKADAFKLVFVEDTENLLSVLTSTLNATKPWTTEGEYYNNWNTYKAYTSSNTQAEILAAINYLNTEYDNYKWENASEEHPYIMENVIKDADHRANDNWTGATGRLTKNINDHWSGGESIVFMANTSGYIRNQTVTVPYEGKYILKTAVRTLTDGAWALIKMGDVENKTETQTGYTGGNVNIDGTEGTDNRANGNTGYGWTFNKVEYISTAENSQTGIGISLSKVENNFVGLEAQTAGMFLCYVGDKFDYTKDGAHYYHGDWATDELNKELTDDVPVLDLTNATVTGDIAITATNPNGLVYTKTGNAITGITNNVVVDGTCANLVLTDGHPFKATKQFMATNASYTMTAVAGGKFGTLMLPFAVNTLPGKAYSLDQGVTYGGDIYATEVNAIAANSPVLVTAKGEYTATEAPVAATAYDTYTNGELVGTYKAMPAEENTFVLQKHGDYVAFFMVKDTKPTVNPFRAYIKAQNGAASKEFVNVIFDGNTTGISNMDTDDNAANDIIYDLSGRRVNKARKGVYIINGKKIVK